MKKDNPEISDVFNYKNSKREAFVFKSNIYTDAEFLSKFLFEEAVW